MTPGAVVLAAGRGTRMQADDPEARLDEAQRHAAEAGLKGLIPFHGHPYLSYVLSAVADAGIRDVCLVVGPGDHPIRRHFGGVRTSRLRLSFAVQEAPLGSANALLAAEGCMEQEHFLVINADNYYPVGALAPLAQRDGSAMAGFRADVLVTRGNIAPERVAAYALVTTDRDGDLEGIVEKPDPEQLRALAGRAWVSMTCWRFGPSIFRACREVAPSVRGEFELPDAVAKLARAGERIHVVPVDEPVLDLSSRRDIESVGAYLQDLVVAL